MVKYKYKAQKQIREGKGIIAVIDKKVESLVTLYIL